LEIKRVESIGGQALLADTHSDFVEERLAGLADRHVVAQTQLEILRQHHTGTEIPGRRQVATLEQRRFAVLNFPVAHRDILAAHRERELRSRRGIDPNAGDRETILRIHRNVERAVGLAKICLTILRNRKLALIIHQRTVEVQTENQIEIHLRTDEPTGTAAAVHQVREGCRVHLRPREVVTARQTEFGSQRTGRESRGQHDRESQKPFLHNYNCLGVYM